MVKKILVFLSALSLLLASCATFQPPPPTIYIGDLPPSTAMELSLDDRITAEDAWQSLKEGNVSKARKLFTRLGTSNPLYYAGNGYAYLIEKAHLTAEQHFLSALEIQKDMALAHLGLAQIFLETGRTELAFGEFREILKKEPAHPWVKPRYESIKADKTRELLNEAKTLLASGNQDESKTVFLRALFYTPDSTEAHSNLARIFINEENYEGALIHLKTASQADPDNLDLLKLRAEALFQAEDFKSSLELFERLEDALPEDQDIKSRLLTIRNRMGIFELPSQYNQIPTLDAVTKQDVAALLSVKFRDIMTEQIQTPPIIVDIATSWAQRDILKTTALGIMDVYPNHEFRPEKIIKRAEMAEILIRLMDYLKLKGHSFIQHISPNRIQISDVSPENYFFNPIVQIISYDIMSLESDRTFGPEQPVSGQDAVKYLDILLALIK